MIECIAQCCFQWYCLLLVFHKHQFSKQNMCLYVYMTLGCNVCGNVGRVFDVNGSYIIIK